MLDREIKRVLLAFIVLISACSETEEVIDSKYRKKSIEIAGENLYKEVYNNLNDSLQTWKLNNLFGSMDTTVSIDQVDSLLCFNSDKNRIVTCLLSRYTSKKEKITNDGILFLLGEKINNAWYFLNGAHITIPRYIVKGHNESTPLSFDQLHKIALKEVYSPYLTESGEINEEWFAQHFEGPGWGDFNNQAEIDWALKGKRFSNKKDFYEYVHLQAAIGQWAARDTTQPIKRLEKTKTVLP